MADPNRSVDRRTLLRGAGGGVVAAAWLVGCGSDDEPSAADGDSTTPADPTSGSGGAGQELVATADVEVGGGVIIDQLYVVTQPAKGDFKGFSAICTHLQCPVASVSGGTINCDCHGSQYSIEDGSVVAGPAPDPLPEQPITVKGEEVLLG